jgi:uncharacterized hydrophobic protein (TIGR00271 family)
MHRALYLVHSPDVDENTLSQALETIEKAAQSEAIPLTFEGAPLSVEPGSVLFVMLPDPLFPEWLEASASLEATAAILPFDGNPIQCKSFSVPSRTADAVAAALGEEPRTFGGYLRCNGRPVLGCVTVGDTKWMGEEGFANILRRLFSMRLRPLQLLSGNEQEIKTAALLVEAGHEAQITLRRSYFFKASDNLCRRVGAVVYAPQSILGALKLRLLLAHRKRSEAETLPEGIGTFKSERLTITPADGTSILVRHGDTRYEAERIELEIVPTELRFVAPLITCVKGEPKESVRAQNLPTDGDLIAFFTKKTLPLVPIAAESSFAELFTRLRDASRISTSYALLLVVSVLMATVGLFQNSSPTIIGAMILAPLMAPIVAFSMGAVRFDETLLTRSGRTILLSTVTALAASALLAMALPFTQVTEQMQMRTHPTLLDLAVAILAGVAAAYGYTHSKVGESLAGVAIAVALVPPLCVAGVGIGYGELHIFTNAFLLYLANIAGIIIASGIVFYLLGYASRKYASAAFAVKLLMVAAIAVPLWLSTRTLVADAKIHEAFAKMETIEVDGIRAHLFLRAVVHKKSGTYAVVYVVTERSLTEKERAELARKIKASLQRDVKLIFTYQELYG